MPRRTVWILASLLLLVAVAASAHYDAMTGVGALRVGMTEEEVSKEIGRTVRPRHAAGAPNPERPTTNVYLTAENLFEQHQHIDVYFDDDNRVTRWKATTITPNASLLGKFRKAHGWQNASELAYQQKPHSLETPARVLHFSENHSFAT